LIFGLGPAGAVFFAFAGRKPRMAADVAGLCGLVLTEARFFTFFLLVVTTI
jgi:hypothetical protein